MNPCLPNKEKRKHVKIETSVNEDVLKHLYPHDVCMFKPVNTPKTGILRLEECIKLASDRVTLLKILENSTNKGHKKFSPDWTENVYKSLKESNLPWYYRLIKSRGRLIPNRIDYDARRTDVISHFLLRVVATRSDEMREWFYRQEVDLFRMRLITLTTKHVFNLFKVNNIDYIPMSNYYKNAMKEDLISSTVGEFDFDTTNFYKIRFLKVHDLIADRSVLVRQGFAYVPDFQMWYCALSNFKAELKAMLMHMSKIEIGDLPQIHHLIRDATKVYNTNIAKIINLQGFETALCNLDKLSKKKYPLCMKLLHDDLRQNHHLKHGARLQYMLFLKGIGLSLEDCLQLWKEEFTHIVTETKFNHDYGYSVKHAYGKVGHMQVHASYSCDKIINTTLKSGEQHGCPFKCTDEEDLEKILKNEGLNQNDSSKIIREVNQNCAMKACKKYYFAKNGVAPKQDILYPEQYYMQACSLKNDW